MTKKSKKPEAMTYDEFVGKHNITMSAREVADNPNYAWTGATHWLVTLHIKLTSDKRQRKLETFYSQGSGFEGAAPKLRDVLCCLVLDASTIDNMASFVEWCAEFGRDSDSISDQKEYRHMVAAAGRFKKFIGDEKVYAALLACVEEGA
jgi:hypothetical protein